MKPEATPWPHWLRAGAALGLSPEAFWRVSVREWRALVAAPEGAALDRAGFAALAARFPDEKP